MKALYMPIIDANKALQGIQNVPSQVYSITPYMWPWSKACRYVAKCPPYLMDCTFTDEDIQKQDAGTGGEHQE